MKHHKILSLFNVALFCVIAGLCYGVALTFTTMPLEGGAIAVLCFGPAYLYLDRKLTPGILIGPSSYVYIYHALNYSVGPLAQRYILNAEVFIEKGMILAQWGAVLGLITFLIVYPIVFRNMAINFSRGKNKRQIAILEGTSWDNYTLLLLLISVIIVVFGYLSGGARKIGGLGSMESSTLTNVIISSFWTVKMVVFFFLGYLAVKRRGWWKFLAVFTYIAYAVFETLEGNRGPLINSMFMMATGLVWAGYSVRKVLIGLCLMAVLAVPLAGVVDVYRSYTTIAQYEEGFFERISNFYVALQKIGTDNNGNEKVAYEAFIYAASALTVDRVMVMTPDVIPYAGLDNMSAIFYIFIPKLFAPNRPIIDDGNSIAAIFGVGEGSNSVFYYVPSVGEGYRRFGWIGIPLIYTLSGAIFGTLLAICWVNRFKSEWMAMFLFLLIQAPGVWSITFNYAVYFALFVATKHYIYFWSLKKLQVLLTSVFNFIRRPWLRQRLIKYQVTIGNNP